jgi:hypothetical protein
VPCDLISTVSSGIAVKDSHAEAVLQLFHQLVIRCFSEPIAPMKSIAVTRGDPARRDFCREPALASQAGYARARCRKFSGAASI